jgi:hypothetical protein
MRHDHEEAAMEPAHSPVSGRARPLAALLRQQHPKGVVGSTLALTEI